MTFTEDDLKAAKALYADLGRLLEESIAGKDFEAPQAHRHKAAEVRLFWWAQGEAALAALEEAWERIAELENKIGTHHLIPKGYHDVENFYLEEEG